MGQDELLLDRLRDALAQLGSVAVAYSGGVDSTLLLRVASDVLGERAVGLMSVSASTPPGEAVAAQALAAQMGARCLVLEGHELESERYLANPPERCYHCKLSIFRQLQDWAVEHGYRWLVDGSNADDLADFRPGRQAVLELNVRSPLAELGIAKAQVRQLARGLGLPNWDLPSSPCLSSRVPYGTPITPGLLQRIGRAEEFLRGLGLRQVRVRHHGAVARIEVLPEDFQMVLEHRPEILAALNGLDYKYTTLDLAGFRSGSLNEVLTNNGRD